MNKNIKSPWFAIIIGIAVIGFAVYSYMEKNSFTDNAIETTGEVVEIYIKKPSMSEKRNGSNNPEYCPIVRFTTENGDTIIFRSNSGSTSYNTYKTGKNVAVMYNKDNPKEARLKSKAKNEMQPLIFGGVGLIMIVVGIFGIAKGKKIVNQ